MSAHWKTMIMEIVGWHKFQISYGWRHNIDVGKGVSLQAIHTPGYTNGGMSFKLQFDEINKPTTNINNHKLYFSQETYYSLMV
jgi:hypothetical protein